MEDFLNALGLGKDAAHTALTIVEFRKKRDLQTKKEKFAQEKVDRQMKKIDKVTPATFECLLEYLNLPKDDVELGARLKEQKEDKKIDKRSHKKDYLYDKLTKPASVDRNLKFIYVLFISN